MNEGQKHRLVKNEALFRDVNERVRELDRRQGGPDDQLWEFLCECGRPDCFERIRMTRSAYEALRSDATRFAIAPGHELPEIERVVDQTAGFAVVEKLPEHQDIARATDPRAQEA